MQYLSVKEIDRINALVMGGTSTLRDAGLLEAAAARPQASAFGKDAYAMLHEKAAALLHSLILNHPFLDGNKRTSVVAIIYFLEKNGWYVQWKQEDALTFFLDIAQGIHDVPTITE